MPHDLAEMFYCRGLLHTAGACCRRTSAWLHDRARRPSDGGVLQGTHMVDEIALELELLMESELLQLAQEENRRLRADILALRKVLA